MIELTDRINQLSYKEVVSNIVILHEHMDEFWPHSKGWSPEEVLLYLKDVRLDRQISLSYSLLRWDTINIQSKSYEGDLILAWTNLGSLVEGMLKFILSIYKIDYDNNPNKQVNSKGKVIPPGEVTFEKLKQHFKKYVWIGSISSNEFFNWIEKIQHKRNAIHSYTNKEIGNEKEFKSAVYQFLLFTIWHLDSLPYPEGTPNILNLIKL